jgi:hypothetical protein
MSIVTQGAFIPSEADLLDVLIGLVDEAQNMRPPSNIDYRFLVTFEKFPRREI